MESKLELEYHVNEKKSKLEPLRTVPDWIAFLAQVEALRLQFLFQWNLHQQKINIKDYAKFFHCATAKSKLIEKSQSLITSQPPALVISII